MVRSAGRRAVLRGMVAGALGSAAGGFAAATGARAAGFPDRPVRIVVAWPPGGGADVPVRVMLPAMQAALGQPVVVDNRGGASGSIGAGVAAQAAPDGYTLLADASSFATNPWLLQNLQFDYRTTFAPVTQVVESPLMLVVKPDLPVADLPGLIGLSRGTPGGIAYASSGIGSGPHLAAVLLGRRAGMVLTHVPFRGSAPAIASLLAGDTAFNFSTLPGAVPLVREGRLRALAVGTPQRLSAMPEVPTVAELGFPGFDYSEWVGLYAPAGTPEPVLTRLNQAAAAGLADPAVRERLAQIGMRPVGSPAGEFAAFVRAKQDAAGALIRAEGIRLE